MYALGVSRKPRETMCTPRSARKKANTAQLIAFVMCSCAAQQHKLLQTAAAAGVTRRLTELHWLQKIRSQAVW